VSTYAQVQHVEEARPRPFTAAEVTLVQNLLDRAERILLRKIDVPARVLNGLTTLPDVRDVLVDMVLRVMRNPQGTTSQTTGPFSQVLDRSVASGRLEITLADRERLGMLTSSGSAPLADDGLLHLFRSNTGGVG
jgi:hypothetical protein